MIKPKSTQLMQLEEFKAAIKRIQDQIGALRLAASAKPALYAVVDDSEESNYVVTLEPDNNAAKATTGYMPHFFKTRAAAQHCAGNFKAVTRRGAVTWRVETAAEYANRVIPYMQTAIKHIAKMAAEIQKTL